ncbi:MAG: class B sortase [Lachnospiraceae bacterium]|nr:class B sortase [Lachnospiraceae bacterium]
MTPLNIVILILLLIFIVALGQILWIMLGYRNADTSYDELTASMKEVTITIFPEGTGTVENAESASAENEEEAEETEETEETVSYTYSITVPDFDYLSSINDDVIGWIQIPGTAVNYPIVQGTDNEFYLTHLYTGETNSSGAIFLDAGTTLGLEDRNAIIFGHNMKNGSMFATLNNYASSGYYSLHPYIVVTDLSGTRYIYDIFAVYYLDSESEVSSSVYLHGFGADENFASYLETVQGMSIYSTGVHVSEDDYIITLSTCKSSSSTVRTIVQAVRR